MFEVPPGMLPAGEYRKILGNIALAYGIVVASQLANISVVLGGYPIPLTADILHELSKHKNFNVITLQAKDEMGGVCAAYVGALGVTSTLGPGLSLKSEALGLRVMTELPLLLNRCAAVRIFDWFAD